MCHQESMETWWHEIGWRFACAWRRGKRPSTLEIGGRTALAHAYVLENYHHLFVPNVTEFAQHLMLSDAGARFWNVKNLMPIFSDDFIVRDRCNTMWAIREIVNEHWVKPVNLSERATFMSLLTASWELYLNLLISKICPRYLCFRFFCKCMSVRYAFNFACLPDFTLVVNQRRSIALQMISLELKCNHWYKT